MILVFVWKKNGRDGSIPFGNDPDLLVRQSCISRQDSAPVLYRFVVFPLVKLVQITPIARPVSVQAIRNEVHKILVIFAPDRDPSCHYGLAQFQNGLLPDV